MIKRIDKIFIFIITFLIFSNVVNYLSHAKMTSLTTVHLFLLTAVFTSYMVFKKPDFSFINIKLNWWILFYFSVILLWFILPHNEFTMPEFRRKMLSVMSIFIFMIFIFYDNKNISTVRQAVLFVTLLSIFNNIYEFINPTAFFPIGSGIGVFGRAAGFYLNPTISGGAIILGVILSFSIVPKVYRMWYIFFSFIGVFLTFSRSAIVGFVLVYLIMTLKKQLHFKYSVFIPILFFVVLSFSLPFLTQYIETTYKGNASNVINRAMWFINPVEHADHSTSQRGYVAMRAFNMFAEHPWIGNGLGSTTHWDYIVSTHNMNLTNMAEFGLIGVFIYPLLLFSVIWRAKGNTRIVASTFIIFTFFISLFSHNILDELYFLFAFSLMANMSCKSQKYDYE